MTFQDVNNGFYNALIEGVGLSRDHFALLQPSSPVLTTASLWNQYFNLVPPEANFVNLVLSSGAQYFDRYKAVWSVLQSEAESQWENKVPEDVRAQFEDFLLSRPSPPSLSQLPALFRNWAFLRHPRHANVGATALANAQLDPIASGALRLMPYQGDPAAEPPVPDRQPDWSETIEDVRAQLAVAPSRQFNYKNSTTSSNVSNTWAKGKSNVFFGVYRSDSNTSRISSMFSENEIELSGSFGHVFTFSPVPGPWFSSAGMKIAYDLKDTNPPWVPSDFVNWTNTFDSNSGSLARFIASLVIVDTMTLTFRSLAKFTVDDQVKITQSDGGGVWPFYTSSSDSGTSTQFQFDTGGEMTVTINSLPGVPIVLGANVFNAADYLF